MPTYDFRELITRATALQEQAVRAGLDPLTVAALVISDRVQLSLENCATTLATLALSSERQPVYGGAA